MTHIQDEIKLLRENLTYELTHTSMSEVGRSLLVGQLIDVLVRYSNPEEVMLIWNASPHAVGRFAGKELPPLPPGMLGSNHPKNTYELLWELCCTMNQKGYQKPETEEQRAELSTSLIHIMQPYASPEEVVNIWNAIRDRLRIVPFPKWDERVTTGKDTLVSNAPSSGHYKGMAIEPLEYIEANGLDFVVGNIVKYVSRYKTKNGVEDLGKALFYLQYLIAREKEKKAS